MSVLRRSKRLSVSNYRFSRFRLYEKAISLIRKHLDLLLSSLSPSDGKCKRLIKMYHLFLFYFYDIATYCVSKKLIEEIFHTAYTQSFHYLLEIDLAIKEGESITSRVSEILKKKIFRYRKEYELFREKKWSTKLWAIEPPREILNIISSYVYR